MAIHYVRPDSKKFPVSYLHLTCKHRHLCHLGSYLYFVKHYHTNVIPIYLLLSHTYYCCSHHMLNSQKLRWTIFCCAQTLMIMHRIKPRSKSILDRWSNYNTSINQVHYSYGFVIFLCPKKTWDCQDLSKLVR